VLATFGVGQVLWSIIWFFIFFLWLMLLFQVTLDIFRSHDLSGPSKALWILLVLVFPYLGVLLYLILRGGKMHEHQVGAVISAPAGGLPPSPSEELHRLAELRDRGVINDDEFTRLKERVIG
jgi:hypothetical protein